MAAWDSETLTYAAVLVGTAIGAAIAYFRKAPAPKQDAVLTGIGVEFGNREQTERLIAEVKRIADALTDKNAANINDRLEELADRFDAMQTPPRRR